jgi:hypothetical protein
MLGMLYFLHCQSKHKYQFHSLLTKVGHAWDAISPLLAVET